MATIFASLSGFTMSMAGLFQKSQYSLPRHSPVVHKETVRKVKQDTLPPDWETLSITSILECKSRKSRNTWSNRQIWPWSTEWSRAKANRVLPGECTGHSKHPLPTTQEKTLHMDITRWSTPKSDWLYSLQANMETLYTVSKNKTGSWQWLRSWTPYCPIQTEIEESGENH